MRITSLGHASLLIEAAQQVVLMDPVFHQPGERSIDPCPARVVLEEALPPADAIVISHHHLDHYDRETLDRLPHGLPVFYPEDEQLHRWLQRDGFNDRRILRPFEQVQLGSLTMLPTPSAVEHAEIGMLFIADGLCAWNQVDNVVTQETATRAHALCGGRLDLLLCPYNPLIEWGLTWVSETDFPQARYERLLEAALMANARTVVPSSSGERAAGELEWANHRIFPVTRERFVEDLRAIAPEVRSLILDPGEAARLQPDMPARKEKTPFARVTERDVEAIAFAPEVYPAPEMTDLNPRRYGEATMQGLIAHVLEERLPRQMQAALDGGVLGPLRRLRDRRARIRLDVTFPSGNRSWSIEAWTPTVRVEAGPPDDADYGFTYVASELFAYASGEPYREPRVRAWRRRAEPAVGDAPFRFTALEPARLADVDPERLVDETFDWHPLILLAN